MLDFNFSKVGDDVLDLVGKLLNVLFSVRESVGVFLPETGFVVG